MDDPKDREYSRAPEIEDVIAICKSLNEQGASYILIGGFAVVFHGYTRGTKDIDFLVDPSVGNIKKMKRALSFLPDNAIALIDDTDVEKHTVVRVADEVVIDLMAKACGIDYTTAKNGIEWVEVEDVRIPIASKELLIRMKDTYRASDQADVQFLRIRLEEEKKSR